MKRINLFSISLALFFIVPAMACAQLAGTYTIDPSKPATTTNYQSILSAITDLTKGTRSDTGKVNGPGVKATVVFEIADGTYKQPLTVTPIKGASRFNTIVFQSASGDSSKVKISWPGVEFTNNSMDYALYLAPGVSYITFKQMTFERTYVNNSSHQGYRVIWLQGVHNNVSFIGNQIKSIKTSWLTGCRLVDVLHDTGKNFLFDNNFLKYGYSGIYWDRGSTGLIIRNNIIDSSYGWSIYLHNTRSPQVMNNTITSDGKGAKAIEIYSCPGVPVITNNRIRLKTGGVGIYVNNYTIAEPSTDSMLIANNAISVYGNASDTYGMSLTEGRFKVFFNSVRMGGRNETIKGFGSLRLKLYNNVFVTDSGTDAFYLSTDLQYNVDADYNNLYSFKYGSLLSDWQAKNKDPHGIGVDPKFLSSTDLHPTSAGMANKGIPLKETDSDLDSNFRSPHRPDMGAYEYGTFANDAGVGILSSPGNHFSPGKKPVTVRIKNFGTDTLKSAEVSWVVNGSPKSGKTWYGKLPPNGLSGPFIIDSFTFTGAQYYTLKLYTSQPNNQPDTDTTNDTLTLTNYHRGLEGIYTIGGTVPDYTTIKSAVADLILYGVAGPVTFRIRNGTYTEKIDIPKIANTSAQNTVTFESESGDSSKVIITYGKSATGDLHYTMRLKDAEYIHLRKLCIRNTSDAYIFSGGEDNICVELTGKVRHCSFTNLYLTGYVTTALFRAVGENDIYDLRFENSLFRRSVKAIWLYAKSDIVIRNNIIDSVGVGMHISKPAMLLVEGNRITPTSIFGTNSIGMELGVVTISHGFYGLRVLNNKIYLPAGGTGIKCSRVATGELDTGLFANNMVSVAGTARSNGMLVGGKVNLYGNSIYVTNTNKQTAALYTSDHSTLRVADNNLTNAGGGCAWLYERYMGFDSKDSLWCDYNNIYSTGTYLIKDSLNTSSNNYWKLEYKTLADWKRGGAKNISLVPDVVSATDLHLKNGSKLRAKGKPIRDLPYDYDGHLRNSFKTDIGADEVGPPRFNASISAILSPVSSNLVCQGDAAIKVKLINTGTKTMDSCRIGCSINDSMQKTYLWKGTLKKGETAEIAIGTYELPSGAVTIKTWPETINGVRDSFLLDDTAYASLTVLQNNRPFISDSSVKCGMDIVTYKTKADTGSKYKWFVQGGKILSRDDSSAVKVQWGDTATGNITVVQTNYLGCKDSFTRTVHIKLLPQAHFDIPATVCSGKPIQFTDSSLNAGSRLWIFAPGKASSQASVTYTFSTPGIYTIRLIAYNSLGCTDTVTKTITVNAAPKAKLAADNTCLSDSVHFTDLSTGAVSRLWDFGDGNSSVLAGPKHLYGAPGKYNISLKVWNAAGCVDSVTTTLLVHEPPIVRFNIKNTCFGSAVSPLDSSTGIVSWYWEFGDGTTSTSSAPDHFYTKPGKYQVTLAGLNASGCADTANRWLEVYNVPNARWTAVGINRNFVFRAADSTTTSSEYVWDFGDGSSDTGVKAIHQYASDSSYVVKLTVTNAFGCSENFDSTITAPSGIKEVSSQNFVRVFPNPFSNKLVIQYSLVTRAAVKVHVYDALGKEVALLERGTKPPGRYDLTWDAAAAQVPPGLYIIKIDIGDTVIIRQAVKN